MRSWQNCMKPRWAPDAQLSVPPKVPKAQVATFQHRCRQILESSKTPRLVANFACSAHLATKKILSTQRPWHKHWLLQRKGPDLVALRKANSGLSPSHQNSVSTWRSQTCDGGGFPQDRDGFPQTALWDSAVGSHSELGPERLLATDFDHQPNLSDLVWHSTLLRTEFSQNRRDPHCF